MIPFIRVNITTRKEPSMNPSRFAVLAASLLAVPAAAQAPIAAAPTAAVTETVSVNGTGRVELAPDRATFTVGGEDPASVGKFLQAAVDAGANTVSGVSFSVSDPARGRDAALQSAMADARAKAEVLARAAGRALGHVIAIAEGGGVRPPVPLAFEMKAMRQAAEVPIEPGTEEESFTV